MAEQSTQKAHVIFSRSDGYRLVPATGAWGGVSPQREVVVDFYIDYRRNPESVDVEMEDGKVTKETRTPEEQPIDRVMQFGLIVRPDIARVIGKFLIERADEALDSKDQ